MSGAPPRAAGRRWEGWLSYRTLRPYQSEAARAILDSVFHRRGLLFTVEMARQGGKNELSAWLEVLLMTRRMVSGGSLVKAAPTFVPQAQISMRRLRERLDDAGLRGHWTAEAGHILRVMNCRQLFLSAEPSANVVGATADVLLEVDEAQDVDAEKFSREFRPMAASANATTVLYGTPWDGHSLLEETARENLEMERRDGVQRHFRSEWQAVAACNPSYREYVEGERARLGEEHPLFRTQYRLLPLADGGGMFSAAQQAQLQGDHARQRAPRRGASCVAAIDVGGEPWGSSGTANPDRDSTVLTIGELDFTGEGPEPRIRVIQHYRWTGEPQHALAPSLIDLLRNVWRCRRVVVDATGLGAGLASSLRKAMGAVGGALRVHCLQQVAAGVRAAGGGQRRAAEDVRGRRLGGASVVLGRGRADPGALPGEPDHGVFRGRIPGARRLSDEPGPAGEGGGVPAPDGQRAHRGRRWRDGHAGEGCGVATWVAQGVKEDTSRPRGRSGPIDTRSRRGSNGGNGET